jgi:hypothetical protein
MLRSALAVLAGFALWTVLWLGSNATLAALLPAAFQPDGSTDHAGILFSLLVLSFLSSVAAGYVAAAVARRPGGREALVLGGLLLAVGLVVQLQYWDVLPAWYHLLFLALLVPGAVLGGRLHAGRRPLTTLPAT